MKVKIFLASLLLSFTAYAFAQDAKAPTASQDAGYKTSFKRNKAGDNWFIHLGVGAQTIFGDHDMDGELMNRMTVAPTLSVGKWFSPYWGVRLKGQGGSLHGVENHGNFMQHDRYYNVHMDAMWDLTNYWGKYNENKFFSFVPYLGLGFAHRMQNDQTIPSDLDLPYNYGRYSNVISMNTGLMFGFRLSKRVNLDLDLAGALVPDYFDRITQNAEYEGITAATLGFTFKLGKSNFEVVEPMDYNLINDLNGKINGLRSENDALSKRPVSCPECPKVAPSTTSAINYVPNVVFFRLNSAKIDANQQISVYNTAQFMKNTGEKIKVVGYADKKTGSGGYNLKISEQRAKAVAKELSAKYNIPSEKIVVEWKGSDEQPYPENNWNRVVIMTAQ